jgi:hypothetical protein
VVDSVVVVCGSLCVGSDPVVSVVGALSMGAVTGTLGVTSTGVAFIGLAGLFGFSGLTGDVGLVGLVTDFVQVFDDVTQSAHKGCP